MKKWHKTHDSMTIIVMKLCFTPGRRPSWIGGGVKKTFHIFQPVDKFRGEQGRIQELWKGGGGGAAAVPFEDPLWNFKRGARAPCAPPPLNPLVVSVDIVAHLKTYCQKKFFPGYHWNFAKMLRLIRKRTTGGKGRTKYRPTAYSLQSADHTESATGIQGPVSISTTDCSTSRRTRSDSPSCLWKQPLGLNWKGV